MEAPAHEKPLLRGKLAADAREALAKLSARFLRLRVSDVASASLAGGAAGIALAHNALDTLFPGAGHQEQAQAHLASAIERLARDTHGTGLYSGFTGVAWAVELLSGSAAEGDLDRCVPIDAALAVHLGQSPWEGPYDLVEGLVGVGVYALERLPRRSAASLIDAIVERLSETARRMPAGPGRSKGVSRRRLSWRSREDWVPESYRTVPHPAWNLGLAHGVPGIIGVLGRICASSCSARTRKKARSLLNGGVAWLLEQELPASSTSCFATCVYDEDSEGANGRPARSAWCYGDPGLAAALLVAGRATSERLWQREAIRIGRRAAARAEKGAGVVDAGLCHGAAGLAHLFHRLYLESGEDEFARAARSWFARTVAMRTARKGFGGFTAYGMGVGEYSDKPSWHPDPGFLTGAAGVALALVAALTVAEPTWDRALLVSGKQGELERASQAFTSTPPR